MLHVFHSIKMQGNNLNALQTLQQMYTRVCVSLLKESSRCAGRLQNMYLFSDNSTFTLATGSFSETFLSLFHNSL